MRRGGGDAKDLRKEKVEGEKNEGDFEFNGRWGLK